MARGINLFIYICNYCNMRCRHCINGDTKLETSTANSEDVIVWIEEAGRSSISSLNFVGGEPFFYQDDLKRYCLKAKSEKLPTSITTNAYWATSKERAIEVLKPMVGLTSLMLSSDVYHLEFVSRANIINAVEACFELGIYVTIVSICANKEDKELIWKTYEDYKSKVFIFPKKPMPMGAAEQIEIDRFVLSDEIERLPCVCAVNSFFVEMDGRVHACCASLLSDDDLLVVGDFSKDCMSQKIERFKQTPLFLYLYNYGPRGLGALLKKSPYYTEFSNKLYTCECDFCVDILSSKERQAYFEERIIELNEAGEEH